MTFLPIVERELRTASRLTATYRNRALLAAAVTAVAVVMMLFGVATAVPSRTGGPMFAILSYLTLFFCLLEGVRKTADCLSEEKREGTLGLLFLTDLKGYDVVLGKLAGVALKSVYGLVGILPVLALPLLMGGVTPGEFWRVVLALLNILFFSLCTGIWVSSWSRGEREATGRTLSIMILCAVASYFTWWVPAFEWSPVYAFRAANAARYFSQSTSYWWSLAAGQALSCLMLVWSSLVLPRTWQEKVVRPTVLRRRESGDPVQRLRVRSQMLDINPAYWLASRNARERVRLMVLMAVTWIAAAAFVISADQNNLVAFGIFCSVLNLILKMRVGAHAAHCLAEARQNNALEMLLSTPLKVDDMIRGQFLAFKRIFLLPLTLILLTEFAGVVAGVLFATAQGSPRRHEEVYGPLLAATLVSLAYVAMFVLDIFALIWAGMWFGLSSKKEHQAATRTVLMVLVAPMLLGSFWFCGAGVLAFIGWPVFWIIWARSELRLKFRDLAARRFVAKRDAGWIPGTGGIEPPPIPYQPARR